MRPASSAACTPETGVVRTVGRFFQLERLLLTVALEPQPSATRPGNGTARDKRSSEIKKPLLSAAFGQSWEPSGIQ